MAKNEIKSVTDYIVPGKLIERIAKFRAKQAVKRAKAKSAGRKKR